MELLISFLITILLISFLIIPKTLKTKTKTGSYKPKSYPFIGSILSFNKNRHRLLHWYTDLLRRSPSLTITIPLLNRRTIITANPQNIEYILKTNFSNFPKGKPFTSLLGDLLGAGIFNVDGDQWSSQRKIASHEFSTRSLKDLVFKILENEVENRLVPVLIMASDDKNVVDLQEILKRFAFDVICQVSLGWDPNCLDLSKKVHPLAKAFDTAAEICARRATEPVNFIWKLKRFLNLGSERKLRDAIRIVHVLVLEIIRSKKEKTLGKNHDLLSRFLNGSDGGGNGGGGDDGVRDMVISFIMAGRDTTSAAMTWLFWLLSENDDVERKLVEEVNELGLGFEELREMNFTKACLCEAMRLYPPVSWDSKHAKNDDVLPDGTRVRSGDKVTYFPYGMGRMEKLWGKDWEEFKPDRWFEIKPEIERPVLKSVSPFKFPVFQAGPRVCLGKEMAFMQMKYVVGSVLSRFEIVPVNKNRPVFVPLLTAHMAGGLMVKIKRRNH